MRGAALGLAALAAGIAVGALTVRTGLVGLWPMWLAAASFLAVLLLAVGSAIPARWLRAGLLLGAFALGLGGMWREMRWQGEFDAAWVLREVGPTRVLGLRGRLLEPPSPLEEAPLLRLSTTGLLSDSGELPARGVAQVRVPRRLLGEAGGLRSGSILQVNGSFTAAQREDEDLLDGRSRWLRAEGVVLRGRATSLEVLESGPRGVPWWELSDWRASTLEVLARTHDGALPTLGTAPRREVGFLAAFLLGDRAWLGEKPLRGWLVGSGLMHLVAISGFHVALIALLSFGAARLLGGAPRRGVYAAALAVLLFWQMSGGRASVERAVLVALLYLVARLVGRPVRLGHALLLVATALLAAKPLYLLDLGFLLSFAAVGMIAATGGFIHGLLPQAEHGSVSLGARLLRWGLGGVLIGVAAQLGVFPLLGSAFGSVPLFPFLHTLAAVPLLYLIYLCAVPGVLLVPVLPELARYCFWLAIWPTKLVLRIIEHGAASGYCTAEVPPFPLPVAASFTAAVLLLAASVALRRKLPAGFAGRTGLRVLAWIIGGAGVLWLVLPTSPSRFVAAFLDVGQGHATLFTLPGSGGGLRLLLDTGPATDTGSAALSVIAPWLSSRRALPVQVLAVTHFDADHAGGVLPLVGRLGVQHLLYGSPPDGSALQQEISTQTSAQGLPPQLLADPAGELLLRLKDNDQSGVFRVVFGGCSVLVTGDQTAPGEAWLARRYGERLRADVLLAGHHGDKRGTTEALLDAVQPRWVVVSCGRENRYGHPGAAMLERVRGRGVPLLRNDEHGHLIFVSDGREIWVER